MPEWLWTGAVVIVLEPSPSWKAYGGGNSLLSILALPQEELAVRRGSVTRSWEGACGRQQTAERACVISGSLAPSVMAVLAGCRGLLGY